MQPPAQWARQLNYDLKFGGTVNLLWCSLQEHSTIRHKPSSNCSSAQHSPPLTVAAINDSIYGGGTTVDFLAVLCRSPHAAATWPAVKAAQHFTHLL